MCFFIFHIAVGLGVGVSGDLLSSCHLSKVVSQRAELSSACACACFVVAICTAFWCNCGLLRNCFFASVRLCDVVRVDVV